MGKKCLFRQVHTVKTEPLPAMGGDPPSLAMAWLAQKGRSRRLASGDHTATGLSALEIDRDAHRPALTKEVAALMFPHMPFSPLPLDAPNLQNPVIPFWRDQGKGLGLGVLYGILLIYH